MMMLVSQKNLSTYFFRTAEIWNAGHRPHFGQIGIKSASVILQYNTGFSSTCHCWYTHISISHCRSRWRCVSKENWLRLCMTSAVILKRGNNVWRVRKIKTSSSRTKQAIIRSTSFEEYRSLQRCYLVERLVLKINYTLWNRYIWKAEYESKPRPPGVTTINLPSGVIMRHSGQILFSPSPFL